MHRITGDWSVRLLGGFEVTSRDELVTLPMDAQRLVAYLALHNGPTPRAVVAGTLWRDGSRERANGSLRSALWRLRSRAEELVQPDSDLLEISALATVDIDAIPEDEASVEAAATHFAAATHRFDAYRREVLPGWYDEWVLVERERLHQRSLHALEAIALRLSMRNCHMSAIEAALAAIDLDPLRESAHRCLIMVHINEGNHSEAVRHYRAYKHLLALQLGLEPSFRLADLLPQTGDNGPVTPRPDNGDGVER